MSYTPKGESHPADSENALLPCWYCGTATKRKVLAFLARCSRCYDLYLARPLPSPPPKRDPNLTPAEQCYLAIQAAVEDGRMSAAQVHMVETMRRAGKLDRYFPQEDA